MSSTDSARPAAAQRIDFYNKQGNKVYVRSTQGRYNRLRWGMVWLTQLVFYGLCWLPWQGRQAVLFDIVERKFYLFGLVLWPQDAIYLALLLMLAAFGLFLFTAVAGRVFCGFACPQTVYTAMFMWIEERTEGPRLARIKLDQEPWHARKIARKGAKYLLWATLAFVTGFTFVGYFTPIKTLTHNLADFSLGPWEGFWLLFYAVFTYLQAGILREQVCKHMCPYSRFQGAMFDADTVTVTYDAARGEPRGARHAKAQAKTQAEPRGDCVDCGICVQVCPAGIDIRQGLQYECIGCGLCVDACNTVMDKVGYARGLIRYGSERMLAGQRWAGSLRRPRIAVYSTLMIALLVGASVMLAQRVPLRVDVIRDRGALMRETDDGTIENIYTLQIHNLAELPRRFDVTVAGLPGIRGQGALSVTVPAGSSSPLPVTVQMPGDGELHGTRQLKFLVTARDDRQVSVTQGSSFILP